MITTALMVTASWLSSSAALAASSIISSERVEVQVLKTVAAQDGPYKLRAYVFEWNGQEVVVMDLTSESNYRSDDTITVQILKRIDSRAKSVIEFFLRPTKPTSPPPYVASPPSAVDSSRRAGRNIELKVLKVFWAQAGEFKFRAYLAEWDGQEVVVCDRHAETTYDIGDPLPTFVVDWAVHLRDKASGMLWLEVAQPRIGKGKKA